MSEKNFPVELQDLQIHPIQVNSAEGYPYRQHHPGELEMVQISTIHARSIEAKSIALWMDEYGTLYAAESYKGMPYTKEGKPVIPFLQKNKLYAYGIRATGLLDTIGCKDTVATSLWMRENGFQTEFIKTVYELDEVLDKDGNKIPMEEWIKQQIESGVIVDEYDTTVSEVDTELVREFLENVKFVVVERYTQVGERLHDVITANSDFRDLAEITPDIPIYFRHKSYTSIEDFQSDSSIEEMMNQWIQVYIRENTRHPTNSEIEKAQAELIETIGEIAKFARVHPEYMGPISAGLEFRHIMDKAFRWVNKYNEINNIPDRFSTKNEQDIINYFSGYYPREVAKYVARMHNLGIIHGNAIALNLESIPALVDLDSVTGEPLGGKKITKTDTDSDVNNVLEAFSTIKPVLNMEGDFGGEFSGYLKQLLTANNIPGDYIRNMKITFIREYAAARNLDAEQLTEQFREQINF